MPAPRYSLLVDAAGAAIHLDADDGGGAVGLENRVRPLDRMDTRSSGRSTRRLVRERGWLGRRGGLLRRGLRNERKNHQGDRAGSSISAWGCLAKLSSRFPRALGPAAFPLEMADAQEALHTRDELDAVDRLAEELVGAAIDGRS